MAAPPAPNPLSRQSRGYRPVALVSAALSPLLSGLLVAVFVMVCAASGPASASAVGRAGRPPAKPAEAATGTKPLVFMGFGTMAGLTLLAGAGLVASVRRRRGNGPSADRC
ncbi:hypothetical protein [Streptomyces sp. NPDC048516]|uniref:hypothetical protein n=1 Tax=Streptomyces sp. NPDC048516 TaxID=3365565 RepID=UPI0037112919